MRALIFRSSCSISGCPPGSPLSTQSMARACCDCADSSRARSAHASAAGLCAEDVSASLTVCMASIVIPWQACNVFGDQTHMPTQLMQQCCSDQTITGAGRGDYLEACKAIQCGVALPVMLHSPCQRCASLICGSSSATLRERHGVLAQHSAKGNP